MWSRPSAESFVSGGRTRNNKPIFRAEIIDCEADTLPLASLVDGQLTEIRPFMPWRHVPGSKEHRQAV
jgi:hypothetical protein